MGSHNSIEQKYQHAQATYRHCAEELAKLEFEIEFSHIEDGTPIPPSFPTPCTYWRASWRQDPRATPPPPSDLLHTDPQTDEPPQLLNISEELEQLLVCPITHEVMSDPWIDNEGNTYEYAAIMAHLAHSKTSPITRTPLFPTKEYLRPNRTLRDIIQLYTKPPSPSLPLRVKKTAKKAPLTKNTNNTPSMKSSPKN